MSQYLKGFDNNEHHKMKDLIQLFRLTLEVEVVPAFWKLTFKIRIAYPHSKTVKIKISLKKFNIIKMKLSLPHRGKIKWVKTEISGAYEL